MRERKLILERDSYFFLEARKLKIHPYKEILFAPALALDGECRRLKGEHELRFTLFMRHILDRKAFP